MTSNTCTFPDGTTLCRLYCTTGPVDTGSAGWPDQVRYPTQNCAGSRLYMLGNKLLMGRKPCVPTAQRGRRFDVLVQSVTV